ncbi:MAG: ankyrin repeat domain-containing protein, partial [Agrobacterium sp.]|nr:ankyrin repeat domain-containing protein [Agrobacterium sp.]
TEILRMILKKGANLESTNRFGGTALIPAAEKGHPEAVDMLLAAGLDVDHVNRLGWTALLEVTILRDGGAVSQRIVRSLLAGGADVAVKDFDGRTALAHARERGLTEIVALLKAAGAKD